jgi:hypothetical protein
MTFRKTGLARLMGACIIFALAVPTLPHAKAGQGCCGQQQPAAGRADPTNGEAAAVQPMPMYGPVAAPSWFPYTGREHVMPHPGTAWHAGYYHPAWGLPVALVVPPRAQYEAQYSWGVGGTRSAFIRHQFSRNYPGPGQIHRQGLRSAPRWPTDTQQLGVYPIRGPW